MVLKLRRINPSSLMPRKAQENGGIFTRIGTKIGDQVLLQIIRRKRKTYHAYNAICVRNMVTVQASVTVQARGNMKLQQLMWKMVIITRNKELKIVQISSSYQPYQVQFPPLVIHGS